MASSSSTPTESGELVPDRYLILIPPDEMSAIERRVADVIRHGFYLQDDSPPGVYLVPDRAMKEGGFGIIVKDDKLELTTTEDTSEGSGSVTAVETFSSVASTSTLGGSPPTGTALFKDMKISDWEGPTFTAEDDPPEVVGSYVQNLVYQDRLRVGMARDDWKGALYCVPITLKIQGQDVNFELEADSGESYSQNIGQSTSLTEFAVEDRCKHWLFHRHACELKAIKDNWDSQPAGGVACTLTLIAETKRPHRRPALPKSYMQSYLAKHFEGGGYQKGDDVPVPSYFHYPRIVYNGTHTLIVGPTPSPIQFGIQNTHNWLTSGPDEEDVLQAAFSFAICDAAMKSVFEDLRMDGLIGFGPEFNMSAFSPNYRHDQEYASGDSQHPSFSTVLQAHLPRVVGKDGGIILYFYLNPPEVDQGYSFLAFNKFPAHLCHRSVRWTSPLYVPKPTGPGRKWRWLVLVKKIVIRLVAEDSYKSRGNDYEDRDLLIQFEDKGAPFHVDTGSCTTTLPTHGMDVLHEAFDRGLPYEVPQWVNLRKSQVEYTFVSRTSEVTLVTSARRFLCDKSRQGLIWDSSAVQPGSEEIYYFGLWSSLCIVLDLELKLLICDLDLWSTKLFRRKHRDPNLSTESGL